MSLAHIPILTGQETYELWAATLEAIWGNLLMEELVLEGWKTDSNASLEEKEAYEFLYRSAVGIFIQVVNSDVLKLIINLKDPHIMWTYLKTQYQRTSAYAVVFQIGCLSLLAASYDSSQPISHYIQKFESEYFRLNKLVGGSEEEHRKHGSNYFSHDKTKRDFLLGFLSRHQKNVVDNLTTKGDLTYDEVKQRLLDTDYGTSSQVALVTESRVDQVKPSWHTSKKGMRVKKSRYCTFCKKHNPSRYLGHVWNNCEFLKIARRDKVKTSSMTNDMANATSTNTENIASTTCQLVPDL